MASTPDFTHVQHSLPTMPTATSSSSSEVTAGLAKLNHPQGKIILLET